MVVEGAVEVVVEAGATWVVARVIVVVVEEEEDEVVVVEAAAAGAAVEVPVLTTIPRSRVVLQPFKEKRLPLTKVGRAIRLSYYPTHHAHANICIKIMLQYKGSINQRTLYWLE